MRLMMRSTILLLATIGSVGTARGQGLTAVALRSADATLPVEFTRIASIRELADRLVLVTDDREGRFGVADFAAGTFHDIGRRGRGPGEYSQLGRLWAAGGDTTIVGDLGKGAALHTIVGVRIVAELAPDNLAVRVGSWFPNGADRRGFVSRTITHGASPDDSLAVVNVHLSSGRIDTIAKLGTVASRASAGGRKAAADGRRTGPSRYMMGMEARDVATLFPDGWTAVLRADPYRVDWCSPKRPCVRGAVLVATMKSISDADKRAYMAFTRKTADWPRTEKLEETDGWPDHVPHYVMPMGFIDASPALPMPDGRLLVQRTPTAASPNNVYDVVARDGTLAARITMGIERRIVGFGQRSVYVAALDGDGIQKLSRHAWP